jgi:hypothetical protein
MAKDEIVKFYGVRSTILKLQKLEPEAYAQFRADIRDITKDGISAIKSLTPKVAPMSGMNNAGVKGWSGVNVSTAITPRQKSRGFGSTTSNLVAISANGRNKQAGFNISDMAGRRSGGKTRSGKAMITTLNARFGAPSRFVYKGLESKLPQIRAEVAISLSKVADRFTKELNK